MGRIRFRGDASGKIFRVHEPSSGEVRIDNESDNITLFRANPTSIFDAGGVQLSSHGPRHRPDGADTMFYMPFGGDISVSIGAGATYTIPAGVYYVKCGANTKAQIYIGGAWQDYSGSGALILVVSDGINARLYNTGAAAESSTLRRVA
jgi:hypothetical protein